MLEEELIKNIYDGELDVADARYRVEACKKDLLDAESKLIGSKIKLDTLNEQLRVILFYKSNYELSEREQEIAQFKERLPAILDKLK